MRDHRLEVLPVDEPGRVAGPGTDAPGADVPGTDTPGADVPGLDAPGADVPGLDAPGADVPETDAGCLPVLCEPLSLPDATVPPIASRAMTAMPNLRRVSMIFPVSSFPA